MNMNHRPSTSEEEYFAREELERRRATARERQSHIDQDERERFKAPRDLHCPKCRVPLQRVTFQDVQVDRCSSCHGTWFDAGELEQFAMENAGAAEDRRGWVGPASAHSALSARATFMRFQGSRDLICSEPSVPLTHWRNPLCLRLES